MYKTTSRFMRGYRGGNVQVGRSKVAATRERKPEFTGVATPGPSVLIKAGEREEELRLALERSIKGPRAQKLTKQRARKLGKEARRRNLRYRRRNFSALNNVRTGLANCIFGIPIIGTP